MFLTEAELRELPLWSVKDQQKWLADIKDDIRSGEVGPNILCRQIDKLAAAIESLMQRIDGYQASRDWSIDALAKAIGVEADKLRALEYYARLASEKLERAEAESARLMHEFQGEHMNLDDLTVGEARKLAALFSTPAVDNSAWDIGSIYLIRTVTMIDTGRLVAITPQELILEDAAWIADTGRFSDALKSLSFNEVEPFPDGRVIVGRGGIIDAIKISSVQRSQK